VITISFYVREGQNGVFFFGGGVIHVNLIAKKKRGRNIFVLVRFLLL
jgi:hypothetical protein